MLRRKVNWLRVWARVTYNLATVGQAHKFDTKGIFRIVFICRKLTPRPGSILAVCDDLG